MKSTISRTQCLVIGFAGLLGFAGSVAGQEAGGGNGTSTDLSFAIYSGAEFTFESDIEGGGDLDVFRLQFGVTGRAGLTPDLDLAVHIGYDVDLYDFSGTSALGIDPWEDIHTFNVGAVLSMQMSNDWTLFGGPVFQFAREDSADLDDSFIGGGVIGATYEVNSSLTVGGGLGMVSQIEDDPRIFPVIVLDWEISDTLRLTSKTAGAAGRSGLELIYDFADNWEAAIGGSYEFRRFRLDDDGVAPGGVGEEKSFPLRARLSYRMSDHVVLDFYAGVVTESELELQSATGVGIGNEDVDTAGLVGFTVRLNF